VVQSTGSPALSLCCWLQGCATDRFASHSMSSSTMVSEQIDHCTTTQNAAQESTLSLAAGCVCCSRHVRSRGQIHCPGCHLWKKKRSSGNKSCWPCEKYMQLHGHWPSDAPAAATSPHCLSSPLENPNWKIFGQNNLIFSTRARQASFKHLTLQ
jgi:hypothetical protein